jgi:hypothetical protein
VDAAGNAYVTGGASAGLLTTPGAYQASYGGGSDDAFVIKLNLSGTALVYSTYIGGAGDEYAQGIVTDAVGNAYVTGMTLTYTLSLPHFPTTANAFRQEPPRLE